MYVYVWVLIVGINNTNGVMVQELGDYSNKNDCINVQMSTALQNKGFDMSCVRVRKVKG